MSLKTFFETMFFAPRWYHRIVSIVLLPFSLFYGVLMWLRRKITPKVSFDVPIISVGNLTVGGSGKTPFVIALASRYKHVAVISRGYGRQSKGLVKVSTQGKLLASVEQSGDEPMLMATSLPNASVIVGEDRQGAIRQAIEEGAELIVLDDGFNRVDIKKFEVLLEPQKMQNKLSFPSGGLREFHHSRKYADCVLMEGVDFVRQVSFENLTQKMVLVTAISQPLRLDVYLPQGVVAKVYLPDHAYFEETHLRNLLEIHGAQSLLCTSKDKIKMSGFKLPISEMKLKLEINEKKFTKIDQYIKEYQK